MLRKCKFINTMFLNTTQVDQVEGEGWVDKNAALCGWAFFTSHGCKL